jgi:hypothetical protein
VIRVDVATLVEAPKETVAAVYADYSGWPQLFPTIRGVRLLQRDGEKVVLEIDHVEGKVRNELLIRSPDEIDLSEVKRRYDARFLNRFEAVRGGTLFTVIGKIRLKGWARLLRPFPGGFIRTRMRRLQLQPVKAEAERRVRTKSAAT